MHGGVGVHHCSAAHSGFGAEAPGEGSDGQQEGTTAKLSEATSGETRTQGKIEARGYEL